MEMSYMLFNSISRGSHRLLEYSSAGFQLTSNTKRSHKGLSVTSVLVFTFTPSNYVVIVAMAGLMISGA